MAQAITLDGLLGRLEEVLGADSLLYNRFALGLRQEDERRLTDALESLRLYPEEVQCVIEDLLMGWVFGKREMVSAVDMKT